MFANNAEKDAIMGKDVSTINLLKKETAVAIANTREDNGFLAIVAKTCRAFPKRVAWVAKNGGRKVANKLAKKDLLG